MSGRFGFSESEIKFLEMEHSLGPTRPQNIDDSLNRQATLTKGQPQEEAYIGEKKERVLRGQGSKRGSKRLAQREILL